MNVYVMISLEGVIENLTKGEYTHAVVTIRLWPMRMQIAQFVFLKLKKTRSKRASIGVPILCQIKYVKDSTVA